MSEPDLVIVVLRIDVSKLFEVGLVTLTPEKKPGEIRELIGPFPLDVANMRAEHEGKERGLPVYLHLPLD